MHSKGCSGGIMFSLWLSRYLSRANSDSPSSTGKKRTLSQLVHRPEPPEQGVTSVTHKSAITDHTVEKKDIAWDNAKVVDRETQRETRCIKKSLCITKTPICMNQDAGSYHFSHIWDQVIWRSRAPSNCIQSTRRDQDVRQILKRCQ